MNKNSVFLIISDITTIIISSILSLLIKSDIQFFNYFNLIKIENLLVFVLVKIFWFKIYDLYRGMYRYTSIWDLIKLLKANFLSSITVYIISSLFLLSGSYYLLSIIILDFILCSAFISASRLSIRIYFSHYKSFGRTKNDKTKLKNVLIIGAGYSGQNIAKQILFGLKNDLNVIGFLDDDISKVGRSLHGVSVIGGVPLLIEDKLNFDEIMICVPSATTSEMHRIVSYCKESGKQFKTLPSLSELMEGKISISQFRDVSFTDLLGREEVLLDKTAIIDFIRGKRVLVTGAGGSIGSELVRQCSKFNPSIIIMLDYSELNLFEIEREVLGNNSNILFKPILSDIRDYSNIDIIFKEYKPQVVFHAAAYKHVPMQENFPWEAVKTNVFGTINLSKLSLKYNIEKFVLVSTDKAVKPTNVMGATKRLAEIIIQSSNKGQRKTEFMAVRFGNVLGSSGSVIPIFKDQIKKGGPITITDPEMERYFMSIPEASQLILQAGSLGKGGEIFILDMGKTIKIIDLALDLIKLSGFEPDQIPIEITGSRPGEKKIEELSLPSEKLDSTKHDKIFVLNDKNVSNNDDDSFSTKIKELKSKLDNFNSYEVKLVLSNIITDYRPMIAKDMSKDDKAKA